MSDLPNENKEILKEIAESIAKEESLGTSTFGEDFNVEKVSDEANVYSVPPELLYSDLRKQKGIQNLEERYKLLEILKIFFGVQLIFMNCVVAIIVIWTVFKFKWFNDIDKDVLQIVISFVKTYITVVLAELLGGIIYVTHKVFSEKFSDNFK